MTFIETVAEADATGEVAALYEGDRAIHGYVPNFTKAFSVAPEVYEAWKGLNKSVKGRMPLRRYELATVAAARRLRSSYCTLAHGSVLLNKGLLDADALDAVVADHETAGLAAVDVAVMDLADKVAGDATAVTQADVDRLRGHGLTDAEIFDVVATAAMRCFFSKTLDALGAEPDATYSTTLEPELRATLTVGRPIADAPTP